ncbi:MAG TPA: nicotinate-nucleotide--dimethylbenzimidazole phosphoribosyltransferase [Solirubrobacteraceae bacterium]|nr:nicotinate-nucleotide--dimethylbenzimidazole phosphoribosyltransferase [Solirubrobacteraceae bacterium]
MSETQRAFDRKTKPRGSLGRLEDLAVRIGALQGVAVPARPECAIVVAAADHGVAAEGVSAYPQEVTAQMVANFADGGAAINVLAREVGARLVVVDAGVGAPTANIARGPAMTRSAAEAQIAAGRAAAAELVADGIGLVGVGDMGIGNTTSAAALCAALLPAAPGAVCGPGTGLDADGVARKAAAVTRALEVNRATAADPLGVLAALGGFEIALLVGVMLGCREARVPVVLDGFITGAAALVAAAIDPAVVDAMIAGHRSPEPGHALVLERLGLEPLLDLRLRLGEGTGAALAIPIVRSALALLNEMASFDDAGVTDAGR